MPIKKAVESNLINFGDLDSGFYAAGGGLPEGDYVISTLDIQMFDGFGQQKSTPRLGVMVTLLPLAGPYTDDAKRQQFYSLGSQADKSFAPDPNTGKGLVAVPGGPATTLNNQTNWAFFLKSLGDSGLPKGIFTNDVSVLEGTHVHMMNVPEPAERAGFQSKTGDAMQDRKPGQIAVVTEIKDDGKPWEGTGGIPDESPKAKAKGPVKVPAKVAPKAKVVEPEPEEVEEEDENVKVAALGAVAVVLEKNQKGMPKASLKLAVGKEVKATYDADMMNSVVTTYFESDDALEALLGEVGFTVSGPMIKPV